MNYIIFALLVCFSSFVKAVTFTHKDLQLDVNGYVGYKYIGSTIKQDTLTSDPELGLLLSLKINNYLSMFTQFQYADEIENALVYSFATFDYAFTDDFQVSINGGKLRHNTAMYNATRINPRTRQGVIPPQAIYWSSLRYMVSSGVGLNIKFKYQGLEIGYTIDDPIVDDPKKEAVIWTGVLLNKINTSFGSHQMVNGIYDFSSIPLKLEVSWTILDFGEDVSPIGKSFNPKNAKTKFNVEFITAGAELKLQDWTLSSEYLIFKPDFVNWSQSKNLSYGTSQTIRYEVNDNVSVYTNYNYYRSSGLGQKNVPSYLTHTHDASVGVNYHRDDWMIGIEGHRVEGGRWLDPIDRQNNGTNLDEWYMIGVNAVYFF